MTDTAIEATAELPHAASFCWSLLAEPRLVPEWIAGVADAEVIEADATGRPLVVHFVGMPSTASVGYTVTYAYDDAARSLRWRTLDGAERRVEGHAWLEELDASRCRFHYALSTWTAGSLPRWAKDTLADDTPERVVRAFERFAARRASAR